MNLFWQIQKVLLDGNCEYVVDICPFAHRMMCIAKVLNFFRHFCGNCIILCAGRSSLAGRGLHFLVSQLVQAPMSAFVCRWSRFVKIFRRRSPWSWTSCFAAGVLSEWQVSAAKVGRGLLAPLAFSFFVVWSRLLAADDDDELIPEALSATHLAKSIDRIRLPFCWRWNTHLNGAQAPWSLLRNGTQHVHHLFWGLFEERPSKAHFLRREIQEMPLTDSFDGREEAQYHLNQDGAIIGAWCACRFHLVLAYTWLLFRARFEQSLVGPCTDFLCIGLLLNGTKKAIAEIGGAAFNAKGKNRIFPIPMIRCLCISLRFTHFSKMELIKVFGFGIFSSLSAPVAWEHLFCMRDLRHNYLDLALARVSSWPFCEWQKRWGGVSAQVHSLDSTCQPMLVQLSAGGLLSSPEHLALVGMALGLQSKASPAFGSNFESLRLSRPCLLDFSRPPGLRSRKGNSFPFRLPNIGSFVLSISFFRAWFSFFVSKRPGLARTNDWFAGPTFCKGLNWLKSSATALRAAMETDILQL